MGVVSQVLVTALIVQIKAGGTGGVDVCKDEVRASADHSKALAEGVNRCFDICIGVGQRCEASFVCRGREIDATLKHGAMQPAETLSIRGLGLRHS